jgi:TRAP-type mannitol/chloroaromatic compound transport system permease small subunit
MLVVAAATAWTLILDRRMTVLTGIARAIDALNSFVGRWVSWLILISVLMVVYLGPYASRSFRSGEMSTNSGGLIIWPAKALLLAGFFLLALQGVSEIIKKIAIMRGRMDDPNPFISAHEQAELDAKALADEVRT